MVSDEQLQVALDAFYGDSIARDVRKMRAALEAAEAAAWRPIEEAPKDGSDVDLWIPAPAWNSTHYSDGVVRQNPNEDAVTAMRFCNCYYLNGEWYDKTDTPISEIIYDMDFPEPSHFRHLPEPPK